MRGLLVILAYLLTTVAVHAAVEGFAGVWHLDEELTKELGFGRERWEMRGNQPAIAALKGLWFEIVGDRLIAHATPDGAAATVITEQTVTSQSSTQLLVQGEAGGKMLLLTLISDHTLVYECGAPFRLYFSKP